MLLAHLSANIRSEADRDRSSCVLLIARPDSVRRRRDRPAGRAKATLKCNFFFFFFCRCCFLSPSQHSALHTLLAPSLALLNPDDWQIDKCLVFHSPSLCLPCAAITLSVSERSIRCADNVNTPRSSNEVKSLQPCGRLFKAAFIRSGASS